MSSRPLKIIKSGKRCYRIVIPETHEMINKASTLIVTSFLLFCAGNAMAAVPSEAKYGGRCAYSLAVKNETMKTDCKVTWTNPQDKAVYCFGSEKAKEQFAKDIKNNIRLADIAYNKTQGDVTDSTISSVEGMHEEGHAMMKDTSRKLEKSGKNAKNTASDMRKNADSAMDDMTEQAITE